MRDAAISAIFRALFTFSSRPTAYFFPFLSFTRLPFSPPLHFPYHRLQPSSSRELDADPIIRPLPDAEKRNTRRLPPCFSFLLRCLVPWRAYTRTPAGNGDCSSVLGENEDLFRPVLRFIRAFSFKFASFLWARSCGINKKPTLHSKVKRGKLEQSIVVDWNWLLFPFREVDALRT